MKKFRLSRRAFLGGAAAMIGLPALEAMTGMAPTAHASGGADPHRLLFYYTPNGFYMPDWRPSGTGTDFELGPSMSALEGAKDDLLIISNLANRNAIDNVAGDHARGTGAFLTCQNPYKSEGTEIRVGISVDQVAANALGDATRFPSLELGLEPGLGVGSCDSGYSCAYSHNISWAGPSTPMPKMYSPQVILDRLFGGADPTASAEAAARRAEYRLSVLDYALEDATRLQGQLGYSDRLKLDEFLTGVRETERAIQEAAAAPVCEATGLPESFSYNLPDYIDVMTDLMIMAMRCDMTRFITFMFGNAGSNRSYRFLDVEGAHHELSHHQNNETNFAKLRVIDHYEMQCFAMLVERMKLVEESDGSTLLDNTTLFFSSEIEDGNSHRHLDLPVLLAGRGCGTLTTGRHLALPEETPIANLYVSMLQNAGVETDSFGADSTGPLEGLLV